jgi:hypothetical protein
MAAVLFDKKDGGALLLDRLDGGEDGLDEDRREAHGRFVEEEERGARHHRAANGEHLLFATRERTAGLLQPFLEPGEEDIKVVRSCRTNSDSA